MARLMFRCQLCGQVVPAGTPSQRLVVKTRQKSYPFRSRVNRLIKLSETGKPKEVFTDDPGGTGREIAQELIVCPSCAQNPGRQEP
jgi:hypothetical protein